MDHRPFDAARAAAIIDALKDGDGTTLPVLHALQEAFGHVPRAAIPMVAAALNLTRADVHGVVSFYADFRDAPPGRHVLKLCRAEACQAQGGRALADRIRHALDLDWGETAQDGSVTLEPAYCLGLCAVAPAAMLDDRLEGRLDAEAADRLIAEAKS